PDEKPCTDSLSLRTRHNVSRVDASSRVLGQILWLKLHRAPPCEFVCRNSGIYESLYCSIRLSSVKHCGPLHPLDAKSSSYIAAPLYPNQARSQSWITCPRRTTSSQASAAQPVSSP